MGELSIWHWLVVALIFGTGKLRDIGSDLGGAVQGFREAMRSGDRSPGQIGESGATRAEPQKDRDSTRV